MNYIICKEHYKQKFRELGFNDFCNLEDMLLYEFIAFDFECTGLEARKHDVFCCQIGNGQGNNYIVVLYNDNFSFYDVIPFIKDKILVGHNLLFDLGFMYKYSFFPEDVRDTMLASKIIYNGDVDNIRHDLGSVFFRELNIRLDKSDQKLISTIKLSQASTITYSFLDVNQLLELHTALQEKIIIGGFEETYKLHCKYIRALAYIEQCGLPISSEMWKAKMEEDIKNTFFWQEKIKEYIYDNIPDFQDGQLDLFNPQKRISINITSPIQMLKVFAKLGIPTKDRDGKDSINENIISKSKHEFVEMWLGFQEANHRVSTFGNRVYDKIEEERIYTNFNPMVNTGRLSTRKGHINFLNFPADHQTRNCFKANEGNIMVVCDFTNQEGVILSDLSKDEAMTDSVLHGVDLHCLLTKKIFKETENLSDDEIKEFHYAKRQQAKISRFALSYGANAYTLHVNQNIPMEEALAIENGFKELHKGVYIWGAKVYATSVDNGYIESADGWKLKLPEYTKFLSLKEKVEAITRTEWERYKQGKIEYLALKKDEKYNVKIWQNYELYKEKKKIVSAFFKLKSEYQRLSLNNPVQSEGSHMTKRAMTFLFDWILKNNLVWKVKICNVPHDEVVVECPTKLKSLVEQNVEKCMIKGGNYYLTDLKIKADAHSGKSWGEAKG